MARAAPDGAANDEPGSDTARSLTLMFTAAPDVPSAARDVNPVGSVNVTFAAQPMIAFVSLDTPPFVTLGTVIDVELDELAEPDEPIELDTDGCAEVIRSITAPRFDDDPPEMVRFPVSVPSAILANTWMP